VAGGFWREARKRASGSHHCWLVVQVLVQTVKEEEGLVPWFLPQQHEGAGAWGRPRSCWLPQELGAAGEVSAQLAMGDNLPRHGSEVQVGPG